MSHIDEVLTSNNLSTLAQPQDASLYVLVKKEVKPLTLDNFFTTMKTMFMEQQTLLYPQDGFIITPTGKYNYNSDKLPIHKRKLLDHPDVCKWKPPHQITIDFRIVKYDNQIALLVFDFSKRQEVPFDGSHIHPLLSTMIHPQLYTNFKQYDNHIVECRYDIVCQQ